MIILFPGNCQYASLFPGLGKRIPYVDFPVTKDSTTRLLIQMVHPCFFDILRKATKEQLAFLRVQKLGGFGPVDNEEPCNKCKNNGGEALDDENPTPSIITTDAC